jgi:hypothetical protein
VSRAIQVSGGESLEKELQERGKHVIILCGSLLKIAIRYYCIKQFSKTIQIVI